MSHVDDFGRIVGKVAAAMSAVTDRHIGAT